jgi:uroporphyrin-III C-methyltransferase/precorrin-2 dehydrogenase/sirohydrochlorin ferrochelatase
MQHGLSKDHSIALIQQATTQNQKVVIGTLETLPKKVRSANIQPPSLVIVGDVVKLHEKLAWFKPLTN